MDGNRVTLQETIFYAESGGQESDSGSSGEHKALIDADSPIVSTFADVENERRY